jgi:dienelactone hydrolase
MKHSLQLMLGPVIFLGVASCINPAPNNPDEVRRTWDAAQVYVWVDEDFSVFGLMGDETTQARLARIPQNQRFATLVFIHGCNGLYMPEWSFLNSLAKEGFAIVAPDSFAREFRTSLCGSQNASNLGAWTNSVRFSEIRFAAEQLREARWADRDNLFLMGHSEGGTYVAAYRGDEFKARIVTGDDCGIGLSYPAATLVVYSTRDYWVRNMNCIGAKKMLSIDSAVHDVTIFQEAQRAIREFLIEMRGSTQN